MEAVLAGQDVLAVMPTGVGKSATRKDAEAYANELAAIGLATVPYHAGMKAADRKRVHQQFLEGRSRCGGGDQRVRDGDRQARRAVRVPRLGPLVARRHDQWGPGVVLRNEEDRVTVRFEETGYRTLLLQAVEENGLLTVAEELPDQGSRT